MLDIKEPMSAEIASQCVRLISSDLCSGYIFSYMHVFAKVHYESASDVSFPPWVPVPSTIRGWLDDANTAPLASRHLTALGPPPTNDSGGKALPSFHTAVRPSRHVFQF